MSDGARPWTNTALIALGTPFAIAIARRLGGPKNASLPNPEGLRAIEARLAHIESTVDAIAVEIERVTEGQRFTTRLLTSGERSRPGAGQ